MRCQIILHVLTPAVLLSLSAGAQAQTAPSGGANMTFFITSVGSGKGADLGGLEGADRHCQTLAAAVGAGTKQWRAYLSTQGQAAVNARDRIGRGPWQNAKGEVIAKDAEELHGTLRAPVVRVGSRNCPVPFSRPLEDAYMYSDDRIEAAIRKAL